MDGLVNGRGNADATRPDPVVFAQSINLPISDKGLLYRALTHRSYRNEHADALEDNERLEFLGDAVLDFMVGAWLYNRFPEMSEGDLTKLRSALVRTEQLAEFARSIGLGSVMRLGRGELESGGRERTGLLCATFEALIGALYLNSGLNPVQDFIQPMLERASTAILLERREQDAKSLLQEAVQARGYGHPIYRTVHAIGPDHEKTFEVEVLIGEQVLGRGVGPSKQSAAKAAAENALNQLE